MLTDCKLPVLLEGIAAVGESPVIIKISNLIIPEYKNQQTITRRNLSTNKQNFKKKKPTGHTCSNAPFFLKIHAIGFAKIMTFIKTFNSKSNNIQTGQITLKNKHSTNKSSIKIFLILTTDSDILS